MVSMWDYLSKLWLRWRFVTLSVLLFLLPWQTAYIFLEKVGVDGSVFEFEKGVVYLVELLVWCLFFFEFLWGKKNLLNSFSVKLWTGIFIGIGLIFVSINPVLSALWIFHAVSSIALGYLLWCERGRVQALVLAFSFGTVIPVFLGIFQFMQGFSSSSTMLGLSERVASRFGEVVVLIDGERVLRAYGSFSHPNIFGAYLAVCSFLLFTGYREDLSKKIKLVYLILLVSCLTGLMITFSKTALFALVIGLSCWFVLEREGRRGLWQKKRWPIAVSFFAVSVCLSLTFSLWQGRINVQDPIEIRSYTERTSQVDEAFALWKIHLWIGVGLGGYTEALQETKPNLPAWEYQPVHNVFLLAAVEMGLMGILLVMVFGFLLLRNGIFTKKMWPFFAVFVVLALFDHYLWTSWSGKTIVMILFVFGLSFLKLDREPVISNNGDHASTLK